MFKEIDYRTTFIASCEIESNNDQLCGFEFRDISMDATLYINSEEVMNSRRNGRTSFDCKLKKGKNKIILI